MILHFFTGHHFVFVVPTISQRIIRLSSFKFYLSDILEVFFFNCCGLHIKCFTCLVLGYRFSVISYSVIQLFSYSVIQFGYQLASNHSITHHLSPLISREKGRISSVKKGRMNDTSLLTTANMKLRRTKSVYCCFNPFANPS